MEPMIDSIKKFGRWIIRVAIWLWEAKVVWIPMLSIVGVLFIWYILVGTWEVRFRLTGLTLELFGIFTVVYGLNETLKLHLPGKIGDWFKRFPKFEDTNNTADIFVQGYGFNSNASGFMSYSPTPDTRLEEQVAELWASLNQTNLQMNKIQKQLKQESKNSLVAINNECSARKASIEEVQQEIKNSAVGEISIEIMGVVWLFFGAIFATASTELACFFDSFPVLLMALNTE